MAGIAPHCVRHIQNSRGRGTEASSLRIPGGKIFGSRDGEQVHTLTEHMWTSTYTAQNRGWLKL